jgi:hypothetical protein
VIGLIFKVFNHEFFFFLSVNDKVFVASVSKRIFDKIVVLGHGRKLLIDLFDIFLQFFYGSFDFFFGFGFFFEYCKPDLDGIVVRIVVRNELEFVAMDSESLEFADFALKIEEHFLFNFFWRSISFEVFLFQLVIIG